MGSSTASALRAVVCDNCGSPIEQKGKGRPRRTCSERCRQAKRRRRRALPWPPVAPPGYPSDPRVVGQRLVEALVAVLEGREPAPPEDQLAQGLLELDWIAYRLAALERELSPRLGSRAGTLAQRIRTARRQVFPEIQEVHAT